MKKILVLLSLVISVSICATVNFKANTKAEIIATNGPTEDEFVKTVNALCIDNVEGTYEKESRAIYKKRNTCGGYYVWYNMREYPVVKNTLKTYKNVNVSSYKYYADCYWHRYFFNL